MSLADALANTPTGQRGGTRCSLCTAMDGMSDDDIDAIHAAMDDPSKPDPWLADLIIAEGYAIARSAVGTHRRGRHRR